MYKNRIVRLSILFVTMITLIICLSASIYWNEQKNENIEATESDVSYEYMIVDVKSRDEGYYSTYANVTLHYYDGELSYIAIENPTLLAFQVPDKYEDGVVIFSGAELNELIEYVNNGNTDSALEILNELYAIEDCPT